MEYIYIFFLSFCSKWPQVHAGTSKQNESNKERRRKNHSMEMDCSKVRVENELNFVFNNDDMQKL